MFIYSFSELFFLNSSLISIFGFKFSSFPFCSIGGKSLKLFIHLIFMVLLSVKQVRTFASARVFLMMHQPWLKFLKFIIITSKQIKIRTV